MRTWRFFGSGTDATLILTAADSGRFRLPNFCSLTKSPRLASRDSRKFSSRENSPPTGVFLVIHLKPCARKIRQATGWVIRIVLKNCLSPYKIFSWVIAAPSAVAT